MSYTKFRINTMNRTKTVTILLGIFLEHQCALTNSATF